VQHGTLPVISPTSIVFDDDGHPIACAGNGSTGGVFRIDRRTGGPGVLIGAVAGAAVHNALAKDFAGNLYVGMYQTGQVHRLAKNINGSYQPPVLIGTVPTPTISGLTFAPAQGSHPDELWITTFGTAGGQMFRMALPAGGVAVAVPNNLAGCNWIDYDRQNNDLLVSTASGNARFMQVNRSSGAATQLCLIQGGIAGVPAYNDANDAPLGRTRAAPMVLNGSTGPFDLELGTTAPPGSLALIGVVAPFVSVIGVAVVGADGHLHVDFPNTILAGPLPPNSLAFAAAYFDAASNLIVGPSLPWPAL